MPTTKSKKPIMLIDNVDVERAVDMMAAANQYGKVLEAKEKEAKQTAVPHLLDLAIHTWLERGEVENPSFRTDHTTGNLIVKEAMGASFILPEETTLRDYLLGRGLPNTLVTLLLQKEFKVQPTDVLVPLEKMPPELAERLVSLIRRSFSTEEAGKILRTETRVRFQPGFLKRSLTYLKSQSKTLAVGILGSLVQVMGSVYPAQMTFVGNAIDLGLPAVASSQPQAEPVVETTPATKRSSTSKGGTAAVVAAEERRGLVKATTGRKAGKSKAVA